MTKIWDDGPEKQGHLLVMLALSDYANDAGECWPSIRSIAEKSRMTERGVQKIIRTLEAEGWLSIATGNGRHGCNQYKINPERGTPPEQGSPRTTMQETPNVDAETPNVDTPEPSITINEPSIDNMSLGLFGDDDKPKEKFRLPDGWVPDADMTGYALSKSLNNDEIERIADDFFAYWDDQPKSKSTKSIRGWRSTWKNRIDAVAWRFIKNRNGGSIHQPRGSAASQEWSNSIANEIADAARSR